MRSKQKRKLRAKYLRAGNRECPICRQPFSEESSVSPCYPTIEHVPPEGFGEGAIPMCLTCRRCNNSAGRGVERAVINRIRGRLRVQRVFPAFPIRNCYVTRLPDHVESSPRLKAAYLSVFSLLGEHGYGYADGEAVRDVLDQILNPDKVIIGCCAVERPGSWPDEWGGVFMNRFPSCWGVLTGDRVVLLPQSWDTSFYRRLAEQGGVTLDAANYWRTAEFGRNSGRTVTVRDEYDPAELLGADLFGRYFEFVADGIGKSYLAADRRGQDITLLYTGHHRSALRDGIYSRPAR